MSVSWVRGCRLRVLTPKRCLASACWIVLMPLFVIRSAMRGKTVDWFQGRWIGHDLAVLWEREAQAGPLRKTASRSRAGA